MHNLHVDESFRILKGAGQLNGFQDVALAVQGRIAWGCDRAIDVKSVCDGS